MTDQELPAFSEALTQLASFYPRNGDLTGTKLAMMFRALAHHPLADVLWAMYAHAAHPTECRFFPMPGQLSAHIAGRSALDGRPTADEAWAIAVQAVDEADTVVWTREIAQAWGLAEPAYEARNTTGARMAFRDCYERLVAEARQRREPVTWLVSEGHDPERRRIAAEAAVAAGRLTQAQAGPLLAAPTRAEPVALLAGPAGGGKAPPEIAARLQALRDKLAAPRDLTERQQRESERLAAAKAEAERLVAEHTRTPA